MVYWQEGKAFRQMEEKASQFYYTKLLTLCFTAMKTNFLLPDIICLTKESPPFALVRLRSDLDAFTRNITAPRKRSLNYIIRKYTRQLTRHQVHSARCCLSFKSFLYYLKTNITSRLVTEQRILVDSFTLRGRVDFRDLRTPSEISDPAIPVAMSRFEGRSVQDPVYFYNEDHNESTVPSGYKMSRLRVNIQQNLGIVGWMLFWHGEQASLLLTQY